MKHYLIFYAFFFCNYSFLYTKKYAPDKKISIQSNSATVEHDNKNNQITIEYLQNISIAYENITIQTEALTALITPNNMLLSSKTKTTLQRPNIKITTDTLEVNLEKKEVLCKKNIEIQATLKKNNESIITQSSAETVIFDLKTKKIHLLSSPFQKVSTKIQIKKAG